jgi:hypothetical protein
MLNVLHLSSHQMAQLLLNVRVLQPIPDAMTNKMRAIARCFPASNPKCLSKAKQQTQLFHSQDRSRFLNFGPRTVQPPYSAHQVRPDCSAKKEPCHPLAALKRLAGFPKASSRGRHQQRALLGVGRAGRGVQRDGTQITQARRKSRERPSLHTCHKFPPTTYPQTRIACPR